MCTVENCSAELLRNLDTRALDEQEPLGTLRHRDQMTETGEDEHPMRSEAVAHSIDWLDVPAEGTCLMEVYVWWCDQARASGE